MVTSRIWFTAAQKAELWERWKNGQSAAAISRALERKNKTGVERIVVLDGGIVPAPRRRALAALRLEEREEISRGIAVGRSIRQIAQGLGRAPSTVSREIRRDGGSQAYRANRADRRSWRILEVWSLSYQGQEGEKARRNNDMAVRATSR